MIILVVIMINKYFLDQHHQELAKVAQGKKRGELYDKLHNLIKEYSMEEVDWVLKIIKEDSNGTF